MRRSPVQQRLRALDAAATPWPRFVYDMFELERMRRVIRAYFRSLALEARLPEEPVSLSFWVASNLAVSCADRLALFVVDNALLRLHMECHFINRVSNSIISQSRRDSLSCSSLLSYYSCDQLDTFDSVSPKGRPRIFSVFHILSHRLNILTLFGIPFIFRKACCAARRV